MQNRIASPVPCHHCQLTEKKVNKWLGKNWKLRFATCRIPDAHNLPCNRRVAGQKDRLLCLPKELARCYRLPKHFTFVDKYNWILRWQHSMQRFYSKGSVLTLKKLLNSKHLLINFSIHLSLNFLAEMLSVTTFWFLKFTIWQFQIHVMQTEKLILSYFAVTFTEVIVFQAMFVWCFCRDANPMLLYGKNTEESTTVWWYSVKFRFT